MNKALAIPFCLLFIAAQAHAFEIVKVQNKTITDQLDEVLGERQAQNSLPIAKGEFWAKLFKCKVSYSDKNHDYSVKVTDDIKALDGKVVQIPGFMYPLSTEEKQKDILLSKRTPVCFFCPPGEPNELLQVKFAKPEEVGSDLVTVEGRFALTNQKEHGIFFTLTDAKLVK